MKKRLVIFLSLFIFCLFPIVYAHSADMSLEIVGAGDNTVTVALATPSGSSPNVNMLQQALRKNLDIVPFFQVIDGQSVPGGGKISAGKNVNLSAFSLAGAQYVVASNWVSPHQVELSLYTTASNRWIFGNRYDVSGEDGLWKMVNTFSDDLLSSIIGKSSLFSSRLAFVKSDGKNKKDLWEVKVNGRDLNRLTNMPGEVISPSWSFNNRQIAFSHVGRRYHSLGVWDFLSHSASMVKFPNSIVVAPCYFPDGKLAVSLTDGSNPSIFLLSSSYQKLGRIDSSYAIDVSPSVDASGTKMVFTSSRGGGPQIFLKDLSTGSVRRISQAGGYNTDPSISPDGSLVVFARQEGDRHKLFLYDILKDRERQITFGGGSDEKPTFCADGYFIAFMSNKNGRRQLFLTTIGGDTPTLINTGSGDAHFPAWSK